MTKVIATPETLQIAAELIVWENAERKLELARKVLISDMFELGKMPKSAIRDIEIYDRETQYIQMITHRDEVEHELKVRRKKLTKIAKQQRRDRK